VAILTLVGFINIPIIKFSVDWWNTLHQPASVIRMDGPTIHPSMLWPLLVMAIAYTLLFFTLHLMAMRNEIWRRRVQTMRRQAAQSIGPRITLVGINYKDKNDNALRFLGELGNPFAAVGVDPVGKAAIDWGVYGIPETYLVAPDGEILFKQIGPFTVESLRDKLLPAIEKAVSPAS
jgi:hypothetical protein